MTGPNKPSDYLHQGRHDRLLKEMDHDPYHSKVKLAEPTLCPECGAIFHKGRWCWGDAPAGADEHLCPACQRVRDRVPAGFLSASGEFFIEHKAEITHLIHNIEQRQKSEHPLQRIMGSEESADAMEWQFTDAHLARAAGEALHHAYQGELDFQYGDEDILLRVRWHR